MIYGKNKDGLWEEAKKGKTYIEALDTNPEPIKEGDILYRAKILPTKSEVDKLVEDHLEPVERKDRFNVQATFRAVDNISAPIKKAIKKILEKELGRELTDFEAQQILAFRDEKKYSASSKALKDYWGKMEPTEFKTQYLGMPYSEEAKKHFFRQFMNDEISCEEYGKLINDKEILKWNPSEKRNVVFDKGFSEKFKHQYLGLPYVDPDLKAHPELIKTRTRNVNLKPNECGKLPGVNYPNRSHPKKRKFSLRKIIKKAVELWTS